MVRLLAIKFSFNVTPDLTLTFLSIIAPLLMMASEPITTLSQTRQLSSLEPFKISAPSQIMQSTISHLSPILQLFPIVEFLILVSAPILVLLPMIELSEIDVVKWR